MTGREPWCDSLIREAKSAALSARGAADVLQGIPAYMSMWATFDRIARNLERAVTEAESSHDRPEAT